MPHKIYFRQYKEFWMYWAAIKLLEDLLLYNKFQNCLYFAKTMFCFHIITPKLAVHSMSWNYACSGVCSVFQCDRIFSALQFPRKSLALGLRVGTMQIRSHIGSQKPTEADRTSVRAKPRSGSRPAAYQETDQPASSESITKQLFARCCANPSPDHSRGRS